LLAQKKKIRAPEHERLSPMANYWPPLEKERVPSRVERGSIERKKAEKEGGVPHMERISETGERLLIYWWRKEERKISRKKTT